MISRATHETITSAAALLRAGRLVAFPTETVYGLGGGATKERPVFTQPSEMAARTHYPPDEKGSEAEAQGRLTAGIRWQTRF